MPHQVLFSPQLLFQPSPGACQVFTDPKGCCRNHLGWNNHATQRVWWPRAGCLLQSPHLTVTLAWTYTPETHHKAALQFPRAGAGLCAPGLLSSWPLSPAALLRQSTNIPDSPGREYYGQGGDEAGACTNKTSIPRSHRAVHREGVGSVAQPPGVKARLALQR